ncbi:type II CRISPR-associated endonuclease Cas1 [uncultured Chitinophaga sp.]|jgi:CRISPR-associated endonuclease Cas1|uniref:type II CRISPR-associated endonuclease Cas1 n=1 Tax=uncultured Chitinophaga sp. TaxID=339340 RepID=UPI00262881AA|nr:type II CRISPR-associated endonuclease Cas1 [uncultured Chitinophaga sp.]
MIKNILSFSNPFHLSVRWQQLVITPKEEGGKEIIRSIEDIGYVFLDHPQITYTHAVLQLLAENNVAIVICDARHHPSSMMMHLDTHHIQAERFRAQIAASEPLRKQLWQQTVKVKIRNQAAVLAKAGAATAAAALNNLANKVLSGDITNCEAQAARIYWKALFGTDFERFREGLPPNPSLNYSYAIVRAAVARALVGSGLLATLGIHHRNKYNAFALADDIMEPYRPFTDWLVFKQVSSIPDYHVLTPERKAEYLDLLNCDCIIKGQTSPMQIAMEITAASLAKCFEGALRKIEYPTLP